MAGRPKTVEEQLAALGVTDMSRVTVDGKPYLPPGEKRQAGVGEAITLRLPLPPPECSPNARCHWARKARAVRWLRDDALAAATTADVCFEHPIISLKFYHPTKRGHDRDNGISSVKGGVDGLADAKLFSNDSQVHWGDVEFLVDKAQPRLMLTITERTQ